jgi:hypothetical protein
VFLQLIDIISAEDAVLINPLARGDHSERRDD